MKLTRHAFILGGFILFLLFVSPAVTYSQEFSPTTYLFAEVHDMAGKAIEGATVTVLNSGTGTNVHS